MSPDFLASRPSDDESSDEDAPEGEPPDESDRPDQSAASSTWDELRAAVGAEEVVTRESLDSDESVEGGDAADPDLIAEAQRIADEALAEARAEEAAEQITDAEADEAEQAVYEDIERLAAERDDYLGQLQRITADFDNYRKRMLKQQSEHVERAAEALVEKLLDALDTFDLALAHGEGFEQVHATLLGVLEKEGLQRIDPVGQPFDPNEADAVAHEDAEEGPLVAQVLRAGYRWKGRVLRPAMVKVRG